MITISQLYIYPIKSLAGIEVDAAEITDRGLKYDRRWMLIDGNNRFLSQREFAIMALMKTRLHESHLEVTYNNDSIKIPFHFNNQEVIEVKIWDDVCTAQLINPAIDQWFSKVIGIPCKLVYMHDGSIRATDQNYAPDGAVTSFADAYPFLLISQASLDDLNQRLNEQIPMNRFRPNIVIAGATPYQEDIINELTINNVGFNGVKLCARCNVPTINQETATAGKEPSRTMAGYRLKNKKIYFGQNLIHNGTGHVAVGDEVKIRSTHTEDRFII